MDDGHGLTPGPGDVPLGREGLLWPNGSRRLGASALEGSGLKIRGARDDGGARDGRSVWDAHHAAEPGGPRALCQFAGVDEAGVVWEWLDKELVWVPVNVVGPDGGLTDERSTVN